MKKFGVVLLLLLQWGCAVQKAGKINGVSFVGSREAASQAHVDALLDIYADYAAVMPFGFIREVGSPEIIFDTDRQWFGETRQGARQYIETLQQNGVSVMLKPQLWIWRGVFTGDLEMASEADWKALEASYSRFILNFADLAEETQVSLFCIGTELEEFVKARPGYWQDLIAQVRQRYSGKITYAANWDEYGRTPFWKSLDFIGIDAYFPLSESREPGVEELREGWKKWKEDIHALSLAVGRPVLFTEYGYRSMDYTAKKPWLVDRNQERVNLQAQANAKTALFEEFWGEDWFAGGFVWKWFIHHPVSGGPGDNRFTPQNKPAQEVIRTYYRLHQ
ncbi:glycoside hydrolase TIM-barrel-like domain-containing protein [Robiginitalea sp. M366]|uniref:glycoside hydrolase family 113 n=1 Tax=Robiginitalea aestuariiviva TaxID=3036903 RepID=UPI00240D9A5A|nr:glycoside hydrolase TIM-barrel-like domain-containing protein [Robiginitalea aestuariiviva]MDG1571851.1 glycoside hydrolase TIM-barrel-like domain-containing protein [Robiginitalea aestuariiviva]